MFAQVQAGIFGASEPVRVGRYVLRGRLGIGGMGVVYAADDADLGRRVAIKLLHGTGSEDQARGRILREAQALAKLSHPGLVPVYDAGTDERDRPWVVMELVEGETLSDTIRGGAVPSARAAEIGRSIAVVGLRDARLAAPSMPAPKAVK